MFSKSDRESVYSALAKLADPSNAEGLRKQRAVLLLCYLRNVKGYDEADAFEFICDSDDDGGLDALILEEHESDSGSEYVLVALQSKYPETSNGTFTDKELGEFVGRAKQLETVAGCEGLVLPDGRK